MTDSPTDEIKTDSPGEVVNLLERDILIDSPTDIVTDLPANTVTSDSQTDVVTRSPVQRPIQSPTDVVIGSPTDEISTDSQGDIIIKNYQSLEKVTLYCDIVGDDKECLQEAV